MRSLIVLSVALAASAAAAEPISLYLVAGQSNAAGQATEPPPANLAVQPVPYEFWLRSLDYVYDVNEPMDLQTLRPFWPLYQWSTYGPELSFADAMTSRGELVAIVKVAQGGVNAFAWQPGITNLYEQLVATTREMLSDLSSLGHEPHIAGLLWVQGEADAAQVAWTADNYQRHLTTIITQLRSDLNAEFPVVLNRLHGNHAAPGFPWAEQVKAAQATVAATLPHVGIVSVDDLGLQPDAVHFTGPTQIALGRRMANWLLPSGDFDFSGAVNDADLAMWNAGHGDANSDGFTDGADFLVWQRQQAGLAITVPEPSVFAMLAVALLQSLARRVLP